MTHSFHPPATKAEADPRRWVALAVLLIASFMNLIDVTIVNVAIPSMQKNLGADPSQIEWVIAGYVLAFALGLLPFGRLGDKPIEALHVAHAAAAEAGERCDDHDGRVVGVDIGTIDAVPDTF